MLTRPKQTIKETDVHMLKEEMTKRRGYMIRIVRYIIDGKPTKMKLEKRGMFLTNAGRRHIVKAQGWTKEDLDLLANRWDEIYGIFERGESFKLVS